MTSSLTTIRRALLLTATAAMLAAPPATAATTWTKILPTSDEAQGLAAAPDGGAYVAVSPTIGGGVASLFRYSRTGTRMWSVELGASGHQVLGLVSDAGGNAYVAVSVSIPDKEGYPYRIQQVKKTGSLGWVATWHDADASLTGDALAISGSKVLIAQRDAATGETTVRRFATAGGAPAAPWSITAANGPAGRPIDLAVTSNGVFVMDTTGKLVALRTSGTWRWSKQLPGDADRGGALAVDANGISVEYEEGFLSLRVRRFGFDGSKTWDKPVPGSGTNNSAVTAVGGTTWAADVEYVNDTVKSQVLIFRFDRTGKVKARVKVGTNHMDSANVLLVSGDFLFIAGYAWAGPNKPILLRIKKP